MVLNGHEARKGQWKEIPRRARQQPASGLALAVTVGHRAAWDPRAQKSDIRKFTEYEPTF